MRDPFAPNLTLSQCYKRRLANIVAYPHLTAQFFHLKTELFFEHIGESLGCEAHWCRYEWQARGSTHAHYFLWLKDAPDVSFLDAWVQDEMHALKHYEGHNDLHYERNVHNDLWGFLMQQHYELPNAANTRSFLMQTLGAS